VPVLLTPRGQLIAVSSARRGAAVGAAVPPHTAVHSTRHDPQATHSF